MKVILKDFIYKGKHFDWVEFDMTNIDNLEDVDVDKFVEHVVKEDLDAVLEDD